MATLLVPPRPRPARQSAPAPRSFSLSHFRSYTDSAEQDEVARVVAAFYDEARVGLAPLLADGGHVVEAVMHSDISRALYTASRKVYGIFVAEFDFETPDLIGGGCFGDRDYDVDLVVTPKGRPLRYSLWEWADALDRPDLVPRNTSAVRDVARMGQLVRGMTHALLVLRDPIARADESVIRRLDEARKRRAAEADAHWKRVTMESAVTAAGVAFRQGEWGRVVQLLEREGEQLSPAQRKKLEIARRRLSGAALPLVATIDIVEVERKRRIASIANRRNGEEP